MDLVWSCYAFKKTFLQLQFKDASAVSIPLEIRILSRVECFNFEDVIWEYLKGRLTSKCPVLLRILFSKRNYFCVKKNASLLHDMSR